MDELETHLPLTQEKDEEGAGSGHWTIGAATGALVGGATGIVGGATGVQGVKDEMHPRSYQV